MKNKNEYKAIPGFSKYEANAEGEVYRKKHYETVKSKRYNDGSQAEYNRLFPRRKCNPTKNKKTGYWTICAINDLGIRATLYVSRAVLTAFNPCNDNKMEVSFIDNCKDNFKLDNLRWVNKSFNRQKGD
jgi:hypothetical protein